MKKRILSFLMALLMVVSIFPAPAYATDSTDVTITSTETPTEEATEIATVTACPTCGTVGCTSAHLTWCGICNVDNCGKTHTACPICNTVDCTTNHDPDPEPHTHDYTGGACACGEACPHTAYESGKCTTCGADEPHTHDYTGGACACGEACPHTAYENGKCTTCGADEPHTHDFTSGACACGEACPHTAYESGKCTTCGADEPHTHDFTGGACACGEVCPHTAYENGKCTTCGADEPHTHDFTGGACACGEVCAHAEYADGKCKVCGMEQPHTHIYTDGKCACGKVCDHAEYADGKCKVCGADETADDEDTSPFHANIGRKAQFDLTYTNFPIVDDPTGITNVFDASITVSRDVIPAELIVKIVDCYVNKTAGIYWYKVEAAEGHTLPAEFPSPAWVFQDYVSYSSGASLLLLDEEPENPCACCDKCTGEEGCTCECGSCQFCEKEPEDELVDGPIYGTINDQIITVSGTLPQDVTVNVAPADVGSQLSQFGVSGEKLVFGLDISLRKDGADYQPGAAVRVRVPVSAAVGTKIGILHTHNGNTTYLCLTEVLSDGTVEFNTNGFSTFAGFTVDFHYNEIDYSIVGLSSIKLSELFTILEIDRQASNAASVVFSDTSLIKVTKTDGDWLLESLKAFDTTEKLEITFINGEIITIVVTDASKGVQTTNDQVHLSTSGTSKTYQIFGKLYPDVNGDYTSFATTLFGVEVDFVLYEGNAYPGSGNGSTVGTAWIDQADFGVQFSLTGSYWYEVYDTYRCQVSEKTGTDNFVFDSTNVLTGREVYIRRYPRTTYYNDNYCKVTQASVMSDSKTTRTVYVHTNGNETPIGSWTGYFPDRTSAAASDLSVVPYKEWRLSKVEVSDGNYHVYLYSVHTITWQNSDKDNTVLEIDENVKYGDAPSYNGSPPTKPDDEGYYYTFKGWSPTVSDVTGNQTYVAEYTKNPYTYYISFNGNGATSGSMNNQSFKFGTAQALTANTYKREYTVTFNTSGGDEIAPAIAEATFNGWEDRGSIVYEGTTWNYTAFDAPYYGKNSSDVFGHANFGNGHFNKYGLLKHYVLHGQNEWNNGSGSASRAPTGSVPGLYPDSATVSNLSTTSGYVVPLYANWTLGSVTLPKPEKEDHIFLGWYSDAALTNSVGDAGDSYTPTENVTLYAKWEENYEEFTISYNLNGGTLPEGKINPESYTKKDSFTLNNPTKPAHTFTGWTGSNGTTPSTNVTIPTGSTGARSYTANWTEKNYTITYDHDYTDEEGNQVISTEDYTIISTSGLLKPTRRGYEFLGWKLETGLTPPDGNWDAGTYSAGTPVTEKYGDVTLVAQWERAAKDLTIRANSTDSDVNFVYTISGQGITITVAVPANSSVTIKSMPVGDYTITEKTAWSWRHTDDYGNRFVTITKTEGEQSVVFDYYGNEYILWLNGYSYGK